MEPILIKTSTGKQQPTCPEAAYVMCQGYYEYHGLTGNKIGLKNRQEGSIINDDALIYYTIVKEVLGEEWLNNGLFRLENQPSGKSPLSEVKGREMKFFKRNRLIYHSL